jgi:GT2 family glycosyltransferase
MKLTIVIPVHNNWHLTRACLEDLAALPDDHEVYIVDNGSTDDTQKLATQEGFVANFCFPKNLIVNRFRTNTGFAHACNLGYAKAMGEYVMFLNNDIRVTGDYKTWTQPIIEAAKDALVSPTAGKLDSNFNFVCEASKMPTTGYRYLSGWNLTASREVFQKLTLSEYIGPFTEEFTTYFEDTDLSLRAQELNIPLRMVSIPVRHLGKMTSKKLDTLKLYLPAKAKFIAKWQLRAQGLLGS